MNIFKKKEQKKKLDSIARSSMLIAVVSNQRVVKLLENSLVEENVDCERITKESISWLNDTIEALNTGIRALT